MIYSNISEIPQEKIEKYHYVSLDFFDTLVIREVSEHSLILKAIAEELHANGCLIDEASFLSAIDKAETYCRNLTANQGGDQEATIDDIYLKAFELSNIDNRYFSKFLAKRKLLEANNLRLINGAKNWMTSLFNRGVKLLLTSDTYYTRQDMSVFLEKLGIKELFHQVYISSEFSINKASGKLFRKLLTDKNVEPECLLHIGDNSYSDVHLAKTLGIKALQVDVDSHISDLEKDTQLYFFGYQVMAPVIGAFTHYLKQYADENNIKSLKFLARDGHLLYRASKLLLDEKCAKEYIYINRIILNQLTTKKLDEKVLGEIVSNYPNQGVLSLVTLFGLENTSFDKHLKTWLKKENYSKKNLLTNDVVSKLLSNRQLVSIFEGDIKRKQTNANNHLQLNNKKGEITCLVDVGWRGSIFKKLNAENQNEHLFGYLFTCTDTLIKNLGAFIHGDNEFKDKIHQVAEVRELIEYCCSEISPACIGFDDDGQPIFLSEASLVQNDKRLTVQQGVMDKLKLTKESGKTWDAKEALNRLISVCEYTPDTLLSVFQLQQVSTSVLDDIHQPLSNSLLNAEAKVNSHLTNTQSGIYRFLSFINQRKLTENTIFLYGAGSGTKLILPHFKGREVIIFDSNEKLNGENLNGSKIISISRLADYTSQMNELIITVIGRKQQLVKSLSEYNVNTVFLEDYLW
ncbi:HAD hydrolase-like protein [Thalassotalea marina]|uniref:HAD family hydrolase n=1 Tax=Thalassotalea marina TaxID=1673741 RepID=A0A919BD98_9GAMM|nr:HAD hydrolase-like protein [Thalassotalea marina]GHF80412.1 hypothetical protein GCM10017161_04620 [Thalassotalea marina]